MGEEGAPLLTLLVNAVIRLVGAQLKQHRINVVKQTLNLLRRLTVKLLQLHNMFV